MSPERFAQITDRYPALRVGVVGDFCLDRYLEIDPARCETSIETGLEVHNVVSVRSQPGAAGTILNNLVALCIGEILPLGFCGEDGEGFELLRALKSLPRVRLDAFLQTAERRTFTYCKPLLISPGQPPRELNRLDSKNWLPTPPTVRKRLCELFHGVAERTDAIIVMDQVDLPETGVVTAELLAAVRARTDEVPGSLIVADSRRALKGWPPVCLKMNERELAALTGVQSKDLSELKITAASLARANSRPVFVTLAERGIIGADPAGHVNHIPSFPVRAEIDIVGAGDAVTANLTAALAAGAALDEALELAMAAASIVIHQLGTTGTASVADLRELLFPR
jgi:rfaE bifunctional protein kinase chain/domain